MAPKKPAKKPTTPTPKKATPAKKPAAKKKAVGSAAPAKKAASVKKAPAKKTAAQRAPANPFTQELADRICQMVEDGKTLRQIASTPGCPASSTIMRWLADPDRAEFREQYARAREAFADRIAHETLEIADDSSQDVIVDSEGRERVNTEFVARARLRVDTRKWFASKIAPKKYGDKLAVGGAEDLGPIQTQHKELTDAERAVRLIHVLKGNPGALAGLLGGKKE